MKEFVVTSHRARTQQPAAVRIDDRGVLTWANGAAEQLFGFTGGRLTGIAMRQLVATAEDDPLSPTHQEALDRGQALTLTFRHDDGYFFTGELTLGASHVDADHPAQATITPLADGPIATHLLRQIEASAALGIWELTVAGNRIAWSQGVYRILGLRSGHELDPEHALFYFQEGQGRIRAVLRRCLQKGRPFSLELPIITAQQRRRWVRLSGQAHYQGEQVHTVSGALVDISAERDQTAAVNHWQHLLQGFLSATSDLVVAFDPQLRVMVLNEAFATQFEASFGIRPKAGDCLSNLLVQYPNENRLYQRLWRRAMECDTFCIEMPLVQQHRHLPAYEFHYHRLTGVHGELIGAVHVARDISARLERPISK